MGWIEHLVSEHKRYESPLSFIRWGGLAAISAVVKDNIWLDRGGLYNLYPNIYVMFHADSGLKKGPPVSMAKNLVRLVGNTRVITGRSSIQGILKQLGTFGQTEKGGKIKIEKSVCFICSSELSSSMVEDKAAMDILTDLYDRHYNPGEWRSLLKMETFDLKDPTITMLTATNSAHSDAFFSKKDIKGGYIARTFIIYEFEENRTNSLMVRVADPPNLEKDAVYLKQLANLKGAFNPMASLEKTEEYKYPLKEEDSEDTYYYCEAGMVYEQWYRDFKRALKQTKDPTGTLNRFGDSVLKVAMLLSLSRHPELFIDHHSMSDAIGLCEKLIGNVRKTTLGKTEEEATNALRKTILIQELMERPTHTITRVLLNKKYWMQGMLEEWDEVALSLQGAGLIDIKTVGNQIVYEMVPAEYEELEKFMKGKMR